MLFSQKEKKLFPEYAASMPHIPGTGPWIFPDQYAPFTITINARIANRQVSYFCP